MEMQDNFPLCKRPFAELANRLGLKEKEVVDRTREMKDRGMIRRIGPLLNVRRMRNRVSCLVGMKVPNTRIEEVAKMINKLPEVSHNYEREDEYNLWFTLSTKSKERMDRILDYIRGKSGLEQILVLPTTKYFKLKVQFDLLEDFHG